MIEPRFELSLKGRCMPAAFVKGLVVLDINPQFRKFVFECGEMD